MPDFLNKEKIVFILATLFAALGLYGFLNPTEYDGRVPRGKRLEEEAASFVSPDLVLADDERIGRESTLDIFAEPVDKKRLKPLDLQSPPLPEIAIAAPPPIPGPPPRYWRGLRHPLPPVAASGGDDGGAGKSNEKEDKKPKEEEKDPKREYDWIVKKGGRDLIFGKITNEKPLEVVAFQKDDEENRFVLKKNVQLSFDYYDTKTGLRRGTEQLATDELEYFALAETHANLYAVKKWGIQQDDVQGRIKIARWLASVGKVKWAEREYREALRLDPRYRDVYLELGQTLEREYLWEEALACYDLARKNGVEDGEIRFREGLLLKRFGMVDRATEIFRETLNRSRDHVHAYLALGTCLLEQGQVDEAVTYLKQAHGGSAPGGTAVMNDLWVEASAKLGTAYLKKGAFAEAARYFQAVVDEDADGKYVAARQGLGAAKYAIGDKEGLDGAVELWTGDGPDALSRFVLINRGYAFARRGNYGAARSALERAAQEDPVNAGLAQIGLGFVAECEGDADKAMEAYEAALLHDPSHPYPRLAMGRILRRQGDAEAAKAELEKVLTRWPDSVDALVELAACAFDGRQPAEALRYLDKGLSVEPDSLELKALRGAALLRSNREDDAMGVFDSVRAKRDDDPVALANAAVIHYRRGEVAKALGHFQTIEEVSGSDPVMKPITAYAKKTAAAIDDNNRKRLWTDLFDRTEIQRNWEVDKPYGVNVRITGGKIEFRGSQRENEKETTMLRTINLGELVSFEAAIIMPASMKANFGIEVLSRRGGRRGGRNREMRVQAGLQLVHRLRGEVGYRIHQDGEWQPWQTLLQRWPDRKVVKLGFERVNELGNKWNLKINGRVAKRNLEVRSFRGWDREASIGVFGSAKIGTDWSGQIEEVGMILREPK